MFLYGSGTNVSGAEIVTAHGRNLDCYHSRVLLYMATTFR